MQRGAALALLCISGMFVAGYAQALPKIYALEWKKAMTNSITIQCGESIKLKWSNDFSGVVEMTRDTCLGPITKLWAPAGIQGEKTIVTPFMKTGTYYFIDPVAKDCDAGQRLKVSVVGTCPGQAGSDAGSRAAPVTSAPLPRPAATVAAATARPTPTPTPTPTPAASSSKASRPSKPLPKPKKK